MKSHKRIVVPIKAPPKPTPQSAMIPRETYARIKQKLHKIASARNTFGQNVQDAQDILTILLENERQNPPTWR